jgi:hypothetical protein
MVFLMTFLVNGLQGSTLYTEPNLTVKEMKITEYGHTLQQQILQSRLRGMGTTSGSSEVVRRLARGCVSPT